MSDEVRVYLLDRAGKQANAFAAKLEGREGVQIAGGAAEVEEALEEITAIDPDVILVGTDVGGQGVVEAVERVLAIMPDTAVVALSTVADKALVSAALRVGAAGSLDRTASPGETITALHVYKRRQQGEQVDMSLAEPPPESTTLKVSGALPRFPGEETEPATYTSPNAAPLSLEAVEPVTQDAEEVEAVEEVADVDEVDAGEGPAPEAAEVGYTATTQPIPDSDYFRVAPGATEPGQADPETDTAANEPGEGDEAEPEYAAPAEMPYQLHVEPPMEEVEEADGADSAGVAEMPAAVETDPHAAHDAEATVGEEDVEDELPMDTDLRQMREMLRREATDAAASSTSGRKRGFLGMFGGRKEKKGSWGPKKADEEPAKTEDTDTQ